MIKKALNIINYARVGVNFLIIILYSMLTLVTLIGVITRYLTFFPSFHGAMEISRYSLIWLVFLVTAINIRRENDLCVKYFINKTNVKFRKFAQITSYTLLIVFFIIMVFYGYRMALANRAQTSPSLNTTMMYAYLAIPVGGFFMIIESAKKLLEAIFDKQKREETCS